MRPPSDARRAALIAAAALTALSSVALASPRSWPAMLRQVEAETVDIDVAAARLSETARRSIEAGRPQAMSALRSDVDALNAQIEELGLRLADLERIPPPDP